MNPAPPVTATVPPLGMGAIFYLPSIYLQQIRPAGRPVGARGAIIFNAILHSIATPELLRLPKKEVPMNKTIDWYYFRGG